VDKLLTATVVDQGIGILPEDEENVWKLFYRGSNIDNHRGLGLGLFIAQQLVETMSGTITLAANPEGQGAVFTVQLPLSIGY
jgi:signal transduction histidine kinase